MCEPVSATILSAALLAGGTGANYMANKKTESARASTMAAERARQEGYKAEAAATNARAQDRYTGYGEKQDARASELAQMFQGSANPTPTSDVAPAPANNVVAAESVKQRGKARDFTDRQGAALGELRAFGDLMGTIGRGQARDAGTIGQIGGFMRGSSGVLPYELEAAKSAGSGMKTLGDILGGLGSIGMNASLGGTFGSTVPSTGTGSTPVSLPTFARPQATAPLTLNQPRGAMGFGIGSANPFTLY